MTDKCAGQRYNRGVTETAPDGASTPWFRGLTPAEEGL